LGYGSNLLLLLVRTRSSSSRWMHSLCESLSLFCGSVGASNPQKLSGAFMDPLTDTVCYAA
jgi:hypothetical protein